MVFGTADPAGTPELWRRYVERLPDGRLELVDDAGHNVFLGMTPAVWAALCDGSWSDSLAWSSSA